MARFPDGYILITKPVETKLENGNVVIDINVEERELVMCKHCKHCTPDKEHPNLSIGNCARHDDGEYGFIVDLDWFCADGEEDSYEDQQQDS